jgi:ribonuclease HI
VEQGFLATIQETEGQAGNLTTRTVYTDGSKMGERAGIGVYSEDAMISLSEPAGSSTVFQAEISAIHRSCAILMEQELQNVKVVILSDSQAAIHALASYASATKMVLNCSASLTRLAQNNEVTVSWVRGHAGNPGNEAADERARNGCTLLGPSAIPLLTPTSAVRREILTWAELQTKHLWEETNSCRQAKELVNSSKRNVSLVLALTKQQLSRYVGLVTGHNLLNRHAALIGVAQDPICANCRLEPETSSHFLSECEALAGIRQRHLGDYIVPLEVLKTLNPSHLLRFTNASGRFTGEQDQ